MKYYSASNNGFYDKRINKKIPDDAVEISDEKHRELIEGQVNGKAISSDENGFPVLINQSAPTKDQLIERACKLIDSAAGRARKRFVSNGDFIDEEYRLTKSQAEKWISGGKPQESVPNTVKAWASAKNWTAEKAADDIIKTGEAWESAVEQIRSLRLSGKIAVKSSLTGGEMDIAQSYIDELNSINP